MTHQAPTETATERPAVATTMTEADEILIDYAGMARLTKYTKATLRKRKNQLPEPLINELDSRGRPHRVLWLREKIVAWVAAGMPKDVDAFDAKWKKGRRA